MIITIFGREIAMLGKEISETFCFFYTLGIG